MRRGTSAPADELEPVDATSVSSPQLASTADDTPIATISAKTNRTARGQGFIEHLLSVEVQDSTAGGTRRAIDPSSRALAWDRSGEATWLVHRRRVAGVAPQLRDSAGFVPDFAAVAALGL